MCNIYFHAAPLCASVYGYKLLSDCCKCIGAFVYALTWGSSLNVRIYCHFNFGYLKGLMLSISVPPLCITLCMPMNLWQVIVSVPQPMYVC